jgi:hypothetical protein
MAARHSTGKALLSLFYLLKSKGPWTHILLTLNPFEASLSLFELHFYRHNFAVNIDLELLSFLMINISMN